MKCIYKYEIDIDTGQVDLPALAVILSVGVQHGRLVCWALVNESASEVVRHLTVIGTGMRAVGDGRFLGTHLLRDGSLVLHVWDEKETES